MMISEMVRSRSKILFCAIARNGIVVTHSASSVGNFSQLTNLKVCYNYSDSPEKELAQYSANLASIMVMMRMRANA